MTKPTRCYLNFDYAHDYSFYELIAEVLHTKIEVRLEYYQRIGPAGGNPTVTVSTQMLEDMERLVTSLGLDLGGHTTALAVTYAVEE